MSFPFRINQYRSHNFLACRVSGYSNKDLQDAQPFPLVCDKFLSWILKMIRKASEATHKKHYPGEVCGIKWHSNMYCSDNRV